MGRKKNSKNNSAREGAKPTTAASHSVQPQQHLTDNVPVQQQLSESGLSEPKPSGQKKQQNRARSQNPTAGTSHSGQSQQQLTDNVPVQQQLSELALSEPKPSGQKKQQNRPRSQNQSKQQDNPHPGQERAKQKQQTQQRQQQHQQRKGPGKDHVTGQKQQRQDSQAQVSPQAQVKPTFDGKKQQVPKPVSETGSSPSQSVPSHSSKANSGHSGSSKDARKPQQISKELAENSPVLNLPGLTVKYKGTGTSGRFLGEIETNYLRLMIQNMVDNAYHYDVKFEPDRPRKLLTPAFLEFVRINFPNATVAFDGRNNAYASARLETANLQREIRIEHPQTGAERTYLVTIQEANDSEIPIKNALISYKNTRQSDDPRRAMQAVEVILKSAFHQPHLRHGIQGGRSFFLPPIGPRTDLGDFYQLWLGLFQSLVLGKLPLLNVDVNHKAFPKRYDTLVDLWNEMQGDYNIENALARHLSGLEICYTNPGTNAKRIYKFISVERTPQNCQFTLEDGRQTNVLEYFRTTGRQINHPNLPCIKIGSTIRSHTIPLEFCSIPDTQIVNRRCTETQTKNIIRKAATSTDDRKQKIMNLLDQIRHNQSATINGFGLRVGTDFVKVPARQLEPPQIQYGQNAAPINPSRGVWNGENKKFLIPESARKWGILNTSFRTRQNELSELAESLFRCSGTNGLQLTNRPEFIQTIDERDLRRIQNELERIGEKKTVDILFCVIPNSGPTYAKIKQLAEIRTGVLTQCIKAATVFNKRRDGSTISNILLKVNTKLNGTNHKLVTNPILSGTKVMVMGADVTHPSPEQNRIPSVVGVAASYDEHAFRYNMCWRLQGQRREMIEDFQSIMKEHLEYFRKKNGGVLPEKILYYRDGVSEGQFDQVMAIERNDMLQACQAVQPGYEKTVKMTIVVVQKRHHTRFFPGKTGIGKDDRKNNNVPAGTIVDSHITRPNENHFYLVSHQSIQGVAKPTKYCILLDEGDHNIDDLQVLTYNLCHLFSRCNRSVSYPAPTYYAHLAAYRGRVYIENERLNMDDLQREWSTRMIRDNIIKGHPMYFV